MLRCQHCGALMRVDWDYCSRCGADLPQADEFEDFDDEEPRPRRAESAGSGTRGMRGALQSARASLGSMRMAYPSGASNAVTARVAPGRLKGRFRGVNLRRGPSAALLLGIVAVVLAAGLAVAWWAALDARDELAAARASQAQAQAAAEAETQRVTGELQAAQATIADLEGQLTAAQQSLADLEAAVAGGEEELGTLAGEIVGLRQQLSTVQSDLDQAVATLEARDATIAEQAGAIAALSDCLAGMQVALAFARSGQLDSADRAFMTVTDSCNRARELL